MEEKPWSTTGFWSKRRRKRRKVSWRLEPFFHRVSPKGPTHPFDRSPNTGVPRSVTWRMSYHDGLTERLNRRETGPTSRRGFNIRDPDERGGEDRSRVYGSPRKTDVCEYYEGYPTLSLSKGRILKFYNPFYRQVELEGKRPRLSHSRPTVKVLHGASNFLPIIPISLVK